MPCHGESARAPSMRRPTVHRLRKFRRLSTRPPSTQSSLPHPRRKLLAMWQVRVAWLPQLTCQRKVVSCSFAGDRRDDEEVLKNKRFFDRSLHSTVHSDHRHGLNTIDRCAYDLVGSGGSLTHSVWKSMAAACRRMFT